MAFFGASSSAPTAPAADVKDIEVSDPPADSISRISFSPTADILAVASWNNEVRFSALVLILCRILRILMSIALNVGSVV